MINIEQLLPKSFRQDEIDYWQMREKILKRYKGKWVAFHQKEIIASGDDLYQVTLEAFQKSRHGAYITKVGGEDQIVTKVRFRQEFDYDSSYQPFPLPRVSVRFSNFHQTRNQQYDQVIPDTGADTTCLPLEDCQNLGLLETPGIRTRSKSYGAGYRNSILFPAYAEISDGRYLCYIEAVEEVERLLGRDVLNQLTAIFRGREQKVIFEG